MNFADDPLPRMVSFKKTSEITPQELFRPQQMNFPAGMHIGTLLSDSDNINLFTVSQKQMLLSTHQNDLFRLHLPQFSNFQEIHFDQDFSTEKIFLSPMGDHGLLRMRDSKMNPAYFYIHGSQKVVESSSRMNFASKSIESVAWNSSANQMHSKETLLGTSDGWILLVSFDATERGNKVMIDLKMLINLEPKQPIYGIQFDYTRALGPGIKGDLYIMAVTNTECYQFTAPGYHDFQQLIELYRDKSNRHMIIKGTKSFPKFHHSNQVLRFLKNENNVVHKALWLYSSGFFIAEFPNGLEHIKTWKKFEFDNDAELRPREVIISDFHVVVQFSNGQHKVFSTIVEDYIHAFQVDQAKTMQYQWENQALYIGADHAKIHHISLEREKQSVWKLLIQKEKYEEAFHSVTGDTQAFVAGMCGDFFFKEKQYDRSITYFLKSDRSFEEVVLKFLDSGERDVLQKFLTERIYKIKNESMESGHKKIQLNLLCSWVLELKLSKLLNKSLQQKGGGAFMDGVGFRAGRGRTTVTVQYSRPPALSEEQTMKDLKDPEIRELEKDLKQFLRNFVNDMTPEIAYQILQNYGRFEQFLELAELNHDYGALILDHINKEEYEAALVKIEGIKDEPRRNELMVRYAGIFLRNIPIEAMKKLRDRKFSKIEIAKLVPALMSVDPAHRGILIEYLLYSLHKNKVRDKTVTNLLVLKLAEDDNKKALWDFLKNEEKKFKNGQVVYFDIEHALNVCRQHDLVRPQVLLYAMLNQYERAVSLALEHFDEDDRLFELAKTYADGPGDQRQVKKLWLRIAQHLLKPGRANIKQALELLQQTEAIKIDDLLPYFPEEEKIESLKEDLAKCLDLYGNKINKLNETMKQYNESSKQLKKAIEDLKERPVVINPGQHCDLSGQPILEEGSDFCIFPCGHCFKLESLFNFWKDYEPINEDLGIVKLMIMRKQGEIDAFKGRKQITQKGAGDGSIDSRSESISRGAGSVLNAFGALFGGGKNKKKTETPGEPVTAGGGSVEHMERQPSFLSQVYSMKLSPDEEQKVNQLIKEFCDYVTNECVLCGDVLIDQAMQTFEPLDDEEAEEEQSWLVKPEML